MQKRFGNYLEVFCILHSYIADDKVKKTYKILALVLITGWAVVHFGKDIIRQFESDEVSVSRGTTAGGSLENGKRLPTSGSNFTTYSRLGALLGRTAVHEKVRNCILEAYAALDSGHPELEFIIGETGWVSGGPFPPHKTHQNGLSVDFMTPILSKEGEVERLPTSVFNKFGYNIEFDEKGAWRDAKIDYEAIALHLKLLSEAARNHGIEIERVIFDPVLQPYLFGTETGKEIKRRLRFSTKRSWVRHDEHYHVDFRLR